MRVSLFGKTFPVSILGLCLVVLANAQDDARSANSASISNRSDARTMTLTIPAPRGLITDRHGEPLAQSLVKYQVNLNFPQLSDESNAAILAWAYPRIETAKSLLENVREISDQYLLEHYQHRRWLPLAISREIDEETAQKLETSMGNGLSLEALYVRYYPEKSRAAHIIGYVRSLGKLPTGPINFGDPLWEKTEGKRGFEELFDEQLKGTDGQRKMLFDSDGTKLLDEIARYPKAGSTLVSTIDLNWQRRAEKVLRKNCERGAFVVIDILTGEVLALASRPSFDLNSFIPRISNEDYEKLRDHPGKPLFGRAFQAKYPPASTFKPIVALEALNNGVISKDSKIDCPKYYEVGRIKIYNWSRKSEGKMAVRRALARSNNPWFCHIGVETTSDEYLSLARRLGFGRKSGLPLTGETEGLVPTDEWMKNEQGRPITQGDSANMSIGQGALLASPLQVAQAMAGIANGSYLPRLHLVRQLQDINGRVVLAARPTSADELKINYDAVSVVHEGMSDVVNAKHGTGKSGAIEYELLAGKTGTAQWGDKKKKQSLAWFAGFFPVENPRYAFAALYEGKPFEEISGGKKAAPMVKSFFNGLKEEIETNLKPPPAAKAVMFDENGEEIIESEEEAAEDEENTEKEKEGEDTETEDDLEAEAVPVGIEDLPTDIIPAEPVKAVPAEEVPE